MRGPTYTVEFYRGEIERLTQLLTTTTNAEHRVQYQRELASARQHLIEFSEK